MRNCKREEHGIENKANIEVEDIRNLVFTDHDDPLDDGGEKESKTVDDGQALKTQHVLYLKLPLLLGPQFEEHPDTQLGDQQKHGYCCL